MANELSVRLGRRVPSLKETLQKIQRIHTYCAYVKLCTVQSLKTYSRDQTCCTCGDHVSGAGIIWITPRSIV